MDSLLVDLDKVLDDFEAEESSPPGHERKPSGFQEYLEKTNQQTWSSLENTMVPVVSKPYSASLYTGEVNHTSVPDHNVNVSYDFPYEPETFDLSEADFGASPLGDSGYKGSLDYSQLSTNNAQNVSKAAENGVPKLKNDLPEPGTPYENVKPGFPNYHCQEPNGFESEKAQNVQNTHTNIDKFPIQAELSPSAENQTRSLVQNGFSTTFDSDKPQNGFSAEVPVYQTQISSLSSVTSNGSDPDKYPIQCNTPQTPKDNPLLNPFDSSLSLSNGSITNENGVMNEKVVNAGENSSQQNGIDNITQDIPKLENLKTDLEQSVAETSINPQTAGQPNMGKFSYSLPASLLVNATNMIPNGANSLPSELLDKGNVFNENANVVDGVVKPQTNDEATVQNSILNAGVKQTSITDNVANDGSVIYSDQSLSSKTGTDNTCNSNIIPSNTDDKGVILNSEVSHSTPKPDVTGFSQVNISEDVNFKPTVIGFGNMVEDSHIDEGDISAYLDDGPESSVVNAKSITDDEVQITAKTVQLSVVDKQPFEPMESIDNKSSDVSVVSQIGDSLCNISNPKHDTVVPELSKMEPGFGVAVEPVVNMVENTEPVVNEVENTEPGTDLEVLKVLADTTLHNSDLATTNSQPVITDLNKATSPNGAFSIDSGCVSMPDNVGDLDESNVPGEVGEAKPIDTGARPKDVNNTVYKQVNNGENVGLSDIDTNTPQLAFMVQDMNRSEQTTDVNQTLSVHSEHAGNLVEQHKVGESRQLMENNAMLPGSIPNQVVSENMENMPTGDQGDVVLRQQRGIGATSGDNSGRPRSWSPEDSGQPAIHKQKRPNSLNLPPPPTIDPVDRSGMEDENSPEPPVNADGAENQGNEQTAEAVTEGAYGGSEDVPYIPPDTSDIGPPPHYTSSLGKVAPNWIPDNEAPVCMSCEARFTFTKRRHHCRACGRVFCSTCCNMKNRLPYMKNQVARVCVMCHSELLQVEREGATGLPPSQNQYIADPTALPQAAGATAQPPPSVLVPVLKRDGNVTNSRNDSSNRRSEPKQVMFSDGIRPGGDLTELDGSSEISRMPPRRSRGQKRVSNQGQHGARSRRLRTVADRSMKCLIPPDDGLPPLALPHPGDTGLMLHLNPKPNDFMSDVKAEDKPPVIFALNTNLYVNVKIITLDCCVNRTVWCFTTRGMTSEGQEEIVTVLEVLPGEETPPKDIFIHLNNVYEDASKGHVITEMGHTIFNQSFLGSRDHGGFLYVRATFQCVQKLGLPNPPFLFAILLQKWETPWAKVFPLRLLLRLGAEYRYYPCPLIGNRNRKPVFFEIGHTIMNLLADFRNYQYMLPIIRGVTIHMEDKATKINFPRNRYEDLMKVVNNSNEHVMAIAATFSSEADSHLVCIQNDDGNYQTQAINIQNKPRKVTGASFVVFNGALKTSSGLTAKSSIVEDGLMVQITPDSMAALKQAIKDMHDYPINCGMIGAPKPDETVIVQWVDDDKNVNIGVKSPVDGMVLDGVESLRIQSATDHVGDKHIIRWTEIFFIQNEERGSPKGDPADVSRIGETVATAFCIALTQHLDKLKEAGLDKIGLRVSLGNENVGYEAGAKGERLPDVYMNDLDNELIPVIHRATQPDTDIVLELIFQVLE